MSEPSADIPTTIGSSEDGLTRAPIGLELVRLSLRKKLFGDEPGEVRIGRYVIVREIGSGGMGTVFEARDEKLQRRVALKLLRPYLDDSRAQQRFLREAQGLAQLSHPNVVPVYDLGHWEGRIWIAMEYVSGQTLGAWVAATKPSQAEIVRNWTAAARGLAAIHAANLIHRDIKPQNVLLGDDGRVRIIDFGLVKTAESDPGQSDPSLDGKNLVSTTTNERGLHTELTDHDSFLGTPAYAAPEHWDGREVLMRSDQYSLCASLWEALCDQRPPRTERTRAGLVPLPEGVSLPRRLHHTLSRGLSLRAADRFPDIDALIAELEPRRRRGLMIAVPTVTAGLATVLTTLAFDTAAPAPAPLDPCAEASVVVERTWTKERRSILSTSLEPEVARSALSFLDDWTGRWAASARTSCEDVHVRHLHSTRAVDRRGVCLQRGLDNLEGLFDELEAGRVTTAPAMIEWFGLLGEPENCLVDAVLEAEYEVEPAEQREAIASVRQRLSKLGLSGSSTHAERLEAAKRLDELAREIGWKPLSGEAAMMLGSLHPKLGDFSAARADFGRALDIAAATSDLALSAEAWSGLTHVGHLTFDRELGEWAAARHAALFEEHEPTPRQRARLLYDQARNLQYASHYPEAEVRFREALEIYEELGAAAAWEQAEARREFANLLVTRGRTDEAERAFEHARNLELGAEPGGGRAMSEALAVVHEGIALISQGEAAKARALVERGLDQAIAQQGPRGELLARAHLVLAAACESLADGACVREHTEQADEISLVAFGPKHAFRIDVLSAVGVVALLDERPAAAVAAFEQSLVLAREHTDPGSLQIALAQRNLANGLHALGRDERAARLAAEALESLEGLLGAEHPALQPTIVTLAEIHLERDELDAAQAYLRRAERLGMTDETRALREKFERASK